MEAERRKYGTAVPKGIFETPERLADQVSPNQPSSPTVQTTSTGSAEQTAAEFSTRQERAGFQMTEESIAEYLRREEEQGASPDALRKRRGFVTSLYAWLPEDHLITEDTLRSWREEMEEKGYARETILNYVKGINRYLTFMGRSDLCFRRGKARELAGAQFGWLTAVEPAGTSGRRDIIWKCQCRCGNTVELPATRLLTGNTLSCGCLRGEHLHSVNKYLDNTSIRQSMKEQVTSSRAFSGYTGVTLKQGKWKAYINYKRKNYYLGCYAELEDAVRARAQAKQIVQEDAQELLDSYEEIHRNDPPRPSREEFLQIKEEKQRAEESKDAVSGKTSKESETTEQAVSSSQRAMRSNNTSGCTGVSRRRGRWTAKITYQKVTYQLGDFEDKEDAVRARKSAEKLLKEDPESFPEKYSSCRKKSVGGTCCQTGKTDGRGSDNR